jgi:hypothetical protein
VGSGHDENFDHMGTVLDYASGCDSQEIEPCTERSGQWTETRANVLRSRNPRKNIRSILTPAHLWLFGLGKGIDLLLGPRVVGVQFENFAVVGDGLIDQSIRLMGHGEEVVGPH